MKRGKRTDSKRRRSPWHRPGDAPAAGSPAIAAPLAAKEGPSLYHRLGGYPGKDMKAAHAEMEITPAVWNAFTGHLNETVARFKIGDRERNELVAIIESVRPNIVNKP